MLNKRFEALSFLFFFVAVAVFYFQKHDDTRERNLRMTQWIESCPVGTGKGVEPSATVSELMAGRSYVEGRGAKPDISCEKREAVKKSLP